MGLLDTMTAPKPLTQGESSPAIGWLLSDASQPQQPSQGVDIAKQLATMLMQSPTPETVGTVIKQLQTSQVPDADKWAQFLPMIANEPDKLKQVATMILNG